MTKAEAVKMLNRLLLYCECPHGDCEKCVDAIDMAIEALEEETLQNLTKPYKSDLISRKDAIDVLKEHRALYCDNTPGTFSKLSYVEKSRVDELDAAIATLVNLPSAQPETPPYVAEIESEYKKWVSMPHINKPLAKALYEVWKKHDREDVSRNG